MILGIDQTIHYKSITHLSSTDNLRYKIFSRIAEKAKSDETYLIFIDGFSPRINELMEVLFITNGIDCNYIGGGAGSLANKNIPCILSNEGLISDAAIISVIHSPVGIGVRHGWESVSGPYIITSSDKNIIKTIDNKPAAEVYLSLLEQFTGKKADRHNFFGIAKAYPFGISKFDTEK
ncbi:MAG: hypothetical protein HC830_10405 [Bacteroidetes bacterium]|nr:hypothetical protein [Bacteroidota bacterium]